MAEAHTPWSPIRLRLIANAIDQHADEDTYRPVYNQAGVCVDSAAARAVMIALLEAGFVIMPAAQEHEFRRLKARLRDQDRRREAAADQAAEYQCTNTEEMNKVRAETLEAAAEAWGDGQEGFPYQWLYDRAETLREGRGE